MGFTLTGKLVVAISSRALFDFEEENRVFEATNDSAYMQLQQDRKDSLINAASFDSIRQTVVDQAQLDLLQSRLQSANA